MLPGAFLQDIPPAWQLAAFALVFALGLIIGYGLGRYRAPAATAAPAREPYEPVSLLDGVVRERDAAFGLVGVQVGSEKLYLPAFDASPGTPVRLKIRARDVALALERPKAITLANVVRAEILNVGGPDGAHVGIRLAVGGQSLDARVTTKSVTVLDLQAGRQVFALLGEISVDRESSEALAPARP